MRRSAKVRTFALQKKRKMAAARRYLPTDRMSELVGDNYTMLLVLGRFGIPLGFGDRSIDDICHRHGVDTQTFLAIVNTMLDENYVHVASELGLSVEGFLSYLQSSHRYYLEFRLPEMRRKLIEAIDCRHGDIAFAVLRFFDAYAGEVRKHLDYEEQTVFPYVQALLAGTADGTYRIETFRVQHDRIADKLTELKNILLQHYPAENSLEWNSVLFDIFTTEADLAMHNFVEDKLFVPAVERLERAGGTPFRREGGDTAAAGDDPLSQREKEIVVCVVKGMTNRQIAERLFLSVHTVITHRRNIAAKLQIRSAAGLTIYAIVHKLVELNDVKDTIYGDDAAAGE